MTAETEPTISLLDAYRQELIESQAKRAIIQSKIDAGEDLGYYLQVLANWDYDIALIEARIAREEANERTAEGSR